MSSAATAIGSTEQSAPISVMRECSDSERGGQLYTILAALSNNSLRQSEISPQGISFSDHQTVFKSTTSSREQYLPQETPARHISTHQKCHQSGAGLPEDNEVTWSSTSSNQNMDLAAEEMEKSPKDYQVSPNIPPLAVCESPSSSDPTWYSTQREAVAESEGLVKPEAEATEPRNPPLRSILKKPEKSTMKPVAMTLDLESVVSQEPSTAYYNHAVFNPNDDSLMVYKSKMADQETDSRRGLIVFIPTSKHRRMSTKHVLQLVAMSACGFILVAIIVAWVLSPTFL